MLFRYFLLFPFLWSSEAQQVLHDFEFEYQLHSNGDLEKELADMQVAMQTNLQQYFAERDATISVAQIATQNVGE